MTVFLSPNECQTIQRIPRSFLLKVLVLKILLKKASRPTTCQCSRTSPAAETIAGQASSDAAVVVPAIRCDAWTRRDSSLFWSMGSSSILVLERKESE